MRIFVFGANGMLGNYVTTYLSQYYTVVPITRHDYDLSTVSIATLSAFMASKQISLEDVVINCAGVIPQAARQRDITTRLYFQVNSIFPVILSTLTPNLIHVTTDCVFTGSVGNYSELSPHDETSDYGLSKSLGELCDATIIRTSIIGEEVHNKRSLLEWVRSSQDTVITGYTNHIWNGVTCLQLAKVIYQIIDKKLQWKGVRHIYSPNTVTKYELVKMVAQAYDIHVTIKEGQTAKSVDKSITSIYGHLFDIPDLYTQIVEQQAFILSSSK